MASAPRHFETLTSKLKIVLALLGISVFINYIDRGNLSIAASMLKDKIGISASQLGILLSAFFWTYACLQPISGWLVDRLNVNRVIAGGFFHGSSGIPATGVLDAFSTLLVLRLLLGIRVRNLLVSTSCGGVPHRNFAFPTLFGCPCN